MPYIITTTTPQPGMVPGEAISVRTPPLVSRRAVATLDEADKQTADLAWEHGATAEEVDALVIGEQGGTVGPLPDGTVIEVREATWDELTADYPDRVNDAEIDAFGDQILDAYNALTKAGDDVRGEILDAYNAAQEAS